MEPVNIGILIGIVLAVTILVLIILRIAKFIEKNGTKVLFNIVKSPIKFIKAKKNRKLVKLNKEVNKRILIADEKQRLNSARQNTSIMNTKDVQIAVNKKINYGNKQSKVKKDKKIL